MALIATRSGPRIVVIDDDKATTDSLARLLASEGFNVVGRAYDGLAGLALIKSTVPDVAIMDIEMPGLDGFEVAKRVNHELERPPQLIAISGINPDKYEKKFAEAGFDACLTKPANWIELESLLNGFAPT
jgi:CheY-like chemotaxis protein